MTVLVQYCQTFSRCFLLSKFVELDLIASNYSRILVICNQKFALLKKTDLIIFGQSLAIPFIVYSLYRFAHSSFASVKKYSLSVALTALYLYNTG